MRCPNCGHVNTDLATRCAACGSALPCNPNDTIPQNTTRPGGTAKRAQVDTESPQPTIVGNTGLRGAVRSMQRLAKRTGRRLGSFFGDHKGLLGIGVVLAVIGVLAAVWLAISAFDAPAYAKVQAEVAALLPTYEYSGGTFGPDLQIPLSNTTITKRAATKAPEGTVVSQGVGPAAFSVEAELTYDDGQIRVVRDVAATYVRKDNGWKMEGELSDHGTSFFARAGVDENKVLSNMGEVLHATSSKSNEPLVDIYANGNFSIAGNNFTEAPDRGAATDDVTIHCAQAGSFYTYEGNVTAHFAFESGEWKLRSSEADRQSTTRSYEPLVGTWNGTFLSTAASNDGARCYGAADHPLSISIDSVGDASSGNATVLGTITVMAHYHEGLSHEAQSNLGDTQLERVDFTGTIDTSFDQNTQSDLNIRCATGGSPDGLVEFVLGFGTKDDPSAAVACVTSTHNYEDTIFFFIPYQTTATFTDTYSLSRA
ncbi:MAG: zinc ribbon domain-containing protein [Coriobacteriales bacterium]|nr:zinc ribbon domain-containing protein [Coriobacteriales bacterium]